MDGFLYFLTGWPTRASGLFPLSINVTFLYFSYPYSCSCRCHGSTAIPAIREKQWTASAIYYHRQCPPTYSIIVHMIPYVMSYNGYRLLSRPLNKCGLQTLNTNTDSRLPKYRPQANRDPKSDTLNDYRPQTP